MDTFHRIVFWTLVFCHHTWSQQEECNNRLGMESKGIPDDSITSSSQLNSNHSAFFARLDGEKAWCSAPGDNSPYIEILLDEEKSITAIETQGSGLDFSWSKTYDVVYWKEGKWSIYKRGLTGNKNIGRPKRNYMRPPIRTRKIRIYPKDPSVIDSTTPRVPCLRLELHGCSASAIDCGVLPTPDKARKVSESHTKIGGVVRFECEEKGYEISGSEIRTCKNNGLWSGNTTSCKIKICGDPGSPKNGKQINVTNNYNYGGTAEFACNDNYTLAGSRKIICEETKDWSSPVPKCWDYSSCGKNPVVFRARIVGKIKSKRGWWPWQIGIYKLNYNVPPSLQLSCGGALISPRWVLTAAHCFYYWNPIFGKFKYRGNPHEYLIKAGDHSLTRNERSEQPVVPDKIFVHHGYKDRKFVNDIALIKLKQKVELGKFVRTVCLPEKDEGDMAIARKYGYVTGWGGTTALKPGELPADGDRYSNVLRHSSYPIQRNQLCANRSMLLFNSTVSFCAGDGKGGKGTCIGDSGGAFVHEGKRGDDYRWVASGLVSWGEGCAQKDHYDYYTRVYSFIDWIKKIVDENTDPAGDEP